MKFTHLFTIPFIAVGLSTFAQNTKKPLDHDVYDKWQSINSESISANGQWIVFSVNPQEGDGNLIVRNRVKAISKEIARGDEAEFTSDSRYTAFLIKPTFAELKAARAKKKKASEMPKDSLGLLDNSTFLLKKFPRLESFLIPEKGSAILVYKEFDKEKEKSKPKGNEKEKDGEKQAIPGRLHIIELKSGKEKLFEDVNEYIMSEDGRFVAFARYHNKKDSASGNGVFIYFPEKEKTQKIASAAPKYGNLSFDKSGLQLAFTAEGSTKAGIAGGNMLYYFRQGKDSAEVVINSNTAGMPEHWEVSMHGEVKFSENSKRLFFGTAEQRTPRDTSLAETEIPSVDIWNYKDDYLQPYQLKNKDKELKRSYLAMLDLTNRNRMIQLADDKLPLLDLGDKGNADVALGTTNYGHRVESQWLGSGIREVFTVSLKDGSRKSIATDADGKAYLSPKGRYAVWFSSSDSSWYSYDMATQQQRNLTRQTKLAFFDELNDVPDMPSAYGISAFSDDDKDVFLYDRYDIWKFSPGTGHAQNLTKGYGRQHKLRFRYYDLHDGREERKRDMPAIVKADQRLYLDAFNTESKMAGWYSTTVKGSTAPQKLVMDSVSYSRPFLAQNASELIYRKENYKRSPDLYVSAGFRAEQKLSDINPWQQGYNWGSAELFKWTTPQGHTSEGILYKPEDFDPSRSYPMIVYFYEKLSDKLFQYIAPAPTPSRLNISFFVSRGYLVFAPDISYETGHPGRSAEEYINSGVEALKKFSWVQRDKIGIQGQSWGGYQVAHLITRTNMYAAAWAGAPVVNMFSAYGGIRWETGMNRQFQYEKTQSRIGATIWEKPELYIENSPLFHLPAVHTPVVIMANDADGAVPWYQGIEMFTALRRLGKPVWMLNYNDEAHNLVKRINRKDIQHREQQFFDHYLKGAPAPVWMERGVPAVDKGKNLGFDMVKPKN